MICCLNSCTKHWKLGLDLILLIAINCWLILLIAINCWLILLIAINCWLILLIAINCWLILLIAINCWLILLIAINCWLILLIAINCWLILLIAINCWLILLIAINCWLILLIAINCWLILLIAINCWLILLIAIDCYLSTASSRKHSRHPCINFFLFFFKAWILQDFLYLLTTSRVDFYICLQSDIPSERALQRRAVHQIRVQSEGAALRAPKHQVQQAEQAVRGVPVPELPQSADGDPQLHHPPLCPLHKTQRWEGGLLLRPKEGHPAAQGLRGAGNGQDQRCWLPFEVILFWYLGDTSGVKFISNKCKQVISLLRGK